MIFSGKARPELISLHIPKTAGTSFRNILKSVYGDEQVVRFDINEKSGVRMNELPYNDNKLPKVKVVHGHFSYAGIAAKFEIPEKCKFITWVRNPVDRVISNYFYLESRLKEILDEENKNLNILSKLQRTLIEYARADINRNRQAKFLAGSALQDFAFVGVTEFYAEEILRLSAILEWEKVPEILFHNKTPDKTTNLSPELVEEIRQLNAEDAVLYDEAIRLRSLR